MLVARAFHLKGHSPGEKPRLPFRAKRSRLVGAPERPREFPDGTKSHADRYGHGCPSAPAMQQSGRRARPEVVPPVVEFGGTAVLDGWLHIEGAGELGVEQIAASDEVGFDVDGELGEATVA
jgi:hypothetical protein